MNKTLKISKRAFWDTNIDSLDFTKHSDYIILRVFERGKWTDVINIINFYGIKKTKTTLLNAEHLSINALHLASGIFKTDLSKFKCYTKKPFTHSSKKS
jgi:hypothetical protein